MTVTVDINVLLDVFQQRQPHTSGTSPVQAITPVDFLAMIAAI